MDEAQRWARTEEIFHQAMERPAGEREAYVERACAGDEDLATRVRALMDAEIDAGDFMAAPVARVRATDTAVGDPDVQIGGYRIIRPLGAGGMGEVFLGLQEGPDFRRFAAIKVLRAGVGPSFADRFARERSILAGLAHPGIARFLGGGATEDGRPFYVMEHVEGERLDHFSDRRLLSVRERVELFRLVCRAVHHAHSNLIVHRDLKPGNILVTPEGQPKLLDFGIAKLLDDADGDPVTRTGFRVATPAYAAPEQLRGDGVTTAADVYALGVLLYELLSGHRPFSLHEAASRAAMDDPPTPVAPSVQVGRFGTRRLPDGEEETVTPEDVSGKRRSDPGALRRALRGDLDNIVLRALRPAPEERYVSAAALSDDLERYLTGEPVRARPDSWTYRAAKFAKRNRAATMAGVALILTLVAWLVGTVRQNQAIRVQAAQISEERDLARAVQGFLLEAFGSVGSEGIAGDSVTVRQVLDSQADLLEDQYGSDPRLRAEMMHVLADGYERLGLYEEAEGWAAEVVQERRASDPGREDSDLARSVGLLGWIKHERGGVDEAEVLLTESLDLWRAIGSDSSGTARALNDLGVVLTNQGRFEESEGLLRESLEIRRAIHPETDRSLGITANNLAAALGYQGQHDEALEMQREAVRLLTRALGPDHLRVYRARRNEADHLAWLGQWEESAQIARAVVPDFERLQSHVDVARAWDSYGTALAQMGRFAEADTALQRGLEVARAAMGDHPVTGRFYGQLMGLRQRQGLRGDALILAREAAAMFGRIYEDHPDLATALRHLGALATDRPEQLRSYQASAEMFGRLQGEQGPGTVRATISWARALLADGQADRALVLFERLRTSVPEAYPAEHPYAVAPHLGQAEARIALGDPEGARRALERARELMTGGVDVEPNRQWLARVEAALPLI